MRSPITLAIMPISFLRVHPPSPLIDILLYSSGLSGKLFLANIGNTVTLFLLVGAYGLLVSLLAQCVPYFRQQRRAMQSFVYDFVVVNYNKLVLAAVIQTRYVRFALTQVGGQRELPLLRRLGPRLDLRLGTLLGKSMIS